jgi:hypothetical protein
MILKELHHAPIDPRIQNLGVHVPGDVHVEDIYNVRAN